MCVCTACAFNVGYAYHSICIANKYDIQYSMYVYVCIQPAMELQLPPAEFITSSMKVSILGCDICITGIPGRGTAVDWISPLALDVAMLAMVPWFWSDLVDFYEKNMNKRTNCQNISNSPGLILKLWWWPWLGNMIAIAKNISEVFTEENTLGGLYNPHGRCKEDSLIAWLYLVLY